MAGYGVDAGDFPAGLIAEMLKGIVADEEAMTDKILTPYNRTTLLEGSITIDGSESGLARGQNQQLGPGVRAQEHRGAITSVSFNARAFVGRSKLPDEAVNNFEALGEDAMKLELTKSRRDANTGLDLITFGSTVLGSTSLNVEYDATATGGGPWDDVGAASNPVTDIRYAKEVSAPGADTIIMGREVKNGLMVHPDVIAELSNFSGGTEDETGLENWLKRKFGFKHVHFLDQMYNAGVTGVVTVTYIGATLCWIGRKSDAINVHPTTSVQDTVDQYRCVDSRSLVTQYSRYDDPIRPTQQLGCVVTNVA